MEDLKKDSIRREDLYYGKVALYNRKKDKIKKNRSILFTLSEYSKINYINSNPALFYDLFYETPKYATTSLKNCKDIAFIGGIPFASICDYYDLNRLNGNIFVYKRINIDTLLAYFGFPEKMNSQECIYMYQNLFNGIFAYENCELFGYQRKESFLWKNGVQIVQGKKLDKYSMDSYDLVKENKLTPYFKVLNQIDYHNPEACFEPFEEEGPIRKRIL